MWRLAVRLIFIFIAIVGHDVKYYVKYFSCDGYGMIYVILSSSPNVGVWWEVVETDWHGKYFW